MDNKLSLRNWKRKNLLALSCFLLLAMLLLLLFSENRFIQPTVAQTQSNPIENLTTYGIISWDETWSGDVHIIGDIIVEEGYTLTIEPGTNITIAAKSDFQNLVTYEPDLRCGIREEGEILPPEYDYAHPGEPFRCEEHHIRILVLGTLHAVGTPDNMITITSDSPNPDIWDWSGIIFENGIFSYCKMDYYNFFHPGDGTVVSHNILRNVGGCAIGAHNGTSIIEYNQIYYAGHELIDIQGGSHIIRYNNLGPNIGVGHCGIVVVNGTSQIYENYIYQSPHGILLLGGTPSIYDNTIEGCFEGMTFDVPVNSFCVKSNLFINNNIDVNYRYGVGPDTGCIRIFIEPQAARDAGAQWRLTSDLVGLWRNSGDIAPGLAPGTYTVTFKEINGLNSPADMGVDLEEGESITIDGP
jgi:hypothetical protein